LTCLPAGKYFCAVPTSTLVDAETVSRLRTVVCQLSRRLNVSTSSVELTPSQISVLGTIAAAGPIGVGDVAEYEGLNATMVSRIVGKLADAGLIDRTPDSHDRRVARVSVTTAGRRVLVRVRAERSQALVDAIERMEDDEAATLIDALAALESLARQFGITTAHAGS
jgi:DNA-binding MarR family transcriptional regulator